MLVLVIMDGWGWRTERQGNAIADAKTPFFSKLDRDTPKTLLKASGLDVGLPEGQMGNSEVGHLNIGAGRILYQELPRISLAIKEGGFFENRQLNTAVTRVLQNGSALHLVGLLSDGGVHSHMDHLFALLDLAKRKGIKNVFIHTLLDGRDTPPKSAGKYITQLQSKISELKLGKIATIMGRYYGMDRDNRWERVRAAYLAMMRGAGETKTDPLEALQESYSNGITDEFVRPTVIVREDGRPTATIRDNDSIIFFNFRADRVRQIVRSFYEKDFQEFEREGKNPVTHITCFTEYDIRFKLPVVFSPNIPSNTLGEILSRRGMRQLRAAETEKYAHVTFFFNGGVEEPRRGEERFLIPSPRIATYDLKPEMSAAGVMEVVLKAVNSGKYEFIVVNFANTDMVGHTGVYTAAVKAVETVDTCVEKIAEAVRKQNGTVLITADHGNVEAMIDKDGNPITSHTTNPVPFYCLSNRSISLRKEGILADIAPTILQLMNIDQPSEMTGESLVFTTRYSA